MMLPFSPVRARLPGVGFGGLGGGLGPRAFGPGGPIGAFGGQQGPPIIRPGMGGQGILGSFKKGGKVPKTGNYHLEEGEHVLTKNQAKKRFSTESSSYNWREHRGGRSKAKESEDDE